MAILGSHFFNGKMFVVKDMQNAVSKAGKVSVTVGVLFKNLDFVVASFGKTVCKRISECVRIDFNQFCKVSARLEYFLDFV